MAKTNTVLIKLVSSADTGFFYYRFLLCHEEESAQQDQ